MDKDDIPNLMECIIYLALAFIAITAIIYMP